MDLVAKYDILQNEKYGRYLVANSDLECGELIFIDNPIAIGPKPGKFFRIDLHIGRAICFVISH